MKSLGMLLVCLFIFAGASNTAAQEPKPWEQYGLSQTEWKVILDSGITMKKVEQLLRSGIGIMEYAQKPWIHLEMSEGAWIERRRAGESQYDLELELTRKDSPIFSRPSTGLQAEPVIPEGSWALAKSFLLPGTQQLYLGEKRKGKIMAGLAIGSLVASVILFTADPGSPLTAAPLFVVAVPDMFWSFFDFKFITSKKH